MKYPLRELPCQDYHRQLEGPPISRRALTTTIEKPTHESIAATGEKGEAIQRETNMTTGLDQLTALVAQLAQRQDDDRRKQDRREEECCREQERCQEEHKEQEEERQRREEERQRREEEYHQEQEEYRREQEECRRQQDAKHQKQLMAVQEQLQALIDEEEYCIKATIVQDLAEKVTLGRDVPLHKHMVERLPKGKQMDLLRQLEVQGKSRRIEIARWESSFRLTRSCSKNQESRGLT